MKVRRVFNILLVVVLLLLLIGCGKKNDDNNDNGNNDNDDNKEKVTYRITASSSVEVGKGLSETANIQVYEGIKKVENPLEYIIVTIDNGSIATFDNGFVGGLEIGNTLMTITCKKDKTVQKLVSITVKEPDSGEVQEHPIEATFGNLNETMTVSETQYIEFEYTCDGEVTVEITSSNEDVISIKKTEDGKYKVVPENKGESTITVALYSSSDNKVKEYNIQVFSNFSPITYELYGGVLPEGAPTEYEEGFNTELMNPVKPGYTFLGWTVGGTGTDYVTAVPENITGPVKIYANWKID